MKLIPACGVLCLFAAGANASPIPAALNPLLNPSQFAITEYATGLSFPYGMTRLSDGSLLVGSSANPAQSFYSSPGQLLRLYDSNNDGVADVTNVLATGLPTAVTAVRQAGNLIVAATSGRNADDQSIIFFRQGATPADALTQVGKIDVDYPTDWWHSNLTLGVRETPGSPGQYDIFFNAGSQNDATASTVNMTLTGMGFAATPVIPDSIYAFTIDPSAGTLAASNLTRIAAGVRNAAGIDFDANGDLIFSDNSFAGGTDELNRMAVADIGANLLDYGFPNSYIQDGTGNVIGVSENPEVAFLPLLGLASRGVAEIAFAPPQFPAGWNDGVFLTFHGAFLGSGAGNQTNPLIFYNRTTGTYFHFLLGGQTGIGHLDSLLATHDSLFVAEFTASGNHLIPAADGAIYQIRALQTNSEVPEPAAVWLSGGGLLLLGLHRSRRPRRG